MESSFGFLSTLTLLGAAQGFFLALALINTKGGDVNAHRLLALLTFLFSLDLGEEFLYQIGFFNSVPHLLHVIAPIDLLYSPLIYLYVLQLTSPAPSFDNKGRYRHFLPAVIGILLFVPFYWLEGPDKLALTEALRTGGSIADKLPNATLIKPGLSLYVLGTILQIGIYLTLSIRRLIRHSRSIKDEFSDIEQINLVWLRNLLIGLGCIFVLYLADQFYPNLMGSNVISNLITITVIALIYTMGYLGLRQPQIFARSPATQSAMESNEAELATEKYRRSGLDKESSKVFLEELTRHMQTGKPYLEGELVLPQLAEQLGISANYLSQIINEQLHVNFYDFVNSYRVEEAKRQIRDAAEQKPNILKIALDSGFNSKSAFYTAFKKVTSMTPSEYRKTLLDQDQ